MQSACGEGAFAMLGPHAERIFTKMQKIENFGEKKEKMRAKRAFFLSFHQNFHFLHFRKNPLVASAGGPSIEKTPSPHADCIASAEDFHCFLSF